MDCASFINDALAHWSEKKVTNPQTQRKVRFWTETFKKLEKDCNVYQDCLNIKGMSNVAGFTCYLDSALFLLLVLPNKHIDRAILFKPLSTQNIKRVCFKTDAQMNLQTAMMIQDALRKTAFSIRSGRFVKKTTCQNLLRILQVHCKESTYPQFFTATQRAPNDFIEFLFDLFDIDRSFSNEMIVTNVYRLKSYTSILTQFTSTTTIANAHCVWNVPSELLQPGSIRRYLKIRDVSHFPKDNPLYLEADAAHAFPIRYRRSTRTFRRIPPYLIFEINRVEILTGAFNETAIIPDPYIHNISLYGVIVHVNYVPPAAPMDGLQGSVGSGHYIAYFKCKGDWYLYDDLRGSIDLVGNYDTLLATTNVRTHGTLYFYSS